MALADEKQLIDRARAGDGDAFGELMDGYLQRIFRLCCGLTGNQQDAEDCTQETFLKAFRSLHLYQYKASFYTWIYRIAVNVCLDFQRAQHHRTTISLDQTFGEDEQTLQIKDDSPLPDEQAINHELGTALLQQISQLSEPMREVLILRDIEGLTYDEIARLMKLSEGTVKSRLFRARNQVVKGMRSGHLSEFAENRDPSRLIQLTREQKPVDERPIEQRRSST